VRALEEAGVLVVLADSFGDALRALKAEGIGSMLVEGGAQLATSLLAENAVDRLIIFQAPVVLGPGSLRAFGDAEGGSLLAPQRLEVLDRTSFGDDVMTVYALNPA
jgi:diaminohydroxyphosphoribosylaminopyrimidine deaminase/5-amino-6-(5-phosphoribosylamino)uracil reductase